MLGLYCIFVFNREAMKKRKIQPKLFKHLCERLFIYVVVSKNPSVTDAKVFPLIAKMGQTLQLSREAAIKYACNETFGKARGLINTDDVILCEDVTELAEKNGFSSDNSYSKFDDYIRPHFSNWAGVVKNDANGASQELHKFETDNVDCIVKLLRNDFDKLQKLTVITPENVYSVREYMKPLFSDSFDSDKALIAGCTGSGKETSTLSSFIHFHNKLQSKFDKNTIHIAIATIPATTMELIKELSTVKGMNGFGGMYYDYSKFKIYVLQSYKKQYYEFLEKTHKSWFDQNVTVVKTVNDIPLHNDCETVPVLIGSYHDLGLQTNGKVKPKYAGIENRIGILSIGEAHNFVSKEENKLWTNIKNLKHKFLLFITGTPYDYIYNSDGDMYFSENERAVFTHMDLMNEKRTNPTGPFGKYPNVNMYGLSISPELKSDVGSDNSFFRLIFTTFDESGDFVYKDAIISIFDKFLNKSKINPYTSKCESTLNIHSANGLCEAAKRHIIFTLPSGNSEASVSDYIPKLSLLLKSSGLFDNIDVFEVYDENSIGDIKSKINQDLKKSITLTCTKYLTGTDIPKWGSVVFLRSVGDSLKLFEQIMGRVKRPSKDKDNCGVFIGSVEEAIDIIISTEIKHAKLGKTVRYKDKVKAVLSSYNFFADEESEWSEIQLDDVMVIMERLAMSLRGNGATRCIKLLKTPDDFNLKVASNGKVSEKLVLNSNGVSTKSTSKTKTTAIQQQIWTSEEERMKSFRNMVESQTFKMRLFCYVEGYTTLSDGIKRIESAIQSSESYVLNLFGEGIEYIPQYMNDPTQFEISTFEFWLERMWDANESIESMMEMLQSSEMQDASTTYYPTPMSLATDMVGKIKQIEKHHKVLNIAGGVGVFIDSLFKQHKNIRRSNIYYIEKDPFKVKFFRKINEKFGLIPDINIYCGDILKPTKEIKKLTDMKFDVIVGNPPYQNSENQRSPLWQEFMVKSIELCKEDGYISLIHPSAWRKPEHKLFNLVKTKDLQYLEIHNQNDGKKVFGAGTRYDWYILKNSEYSGKTEIVDERGDQLEIDIRNWKFLPNYMYDTFDKLFAKSGDETCEVIHSRSMYGNDKPNMSTEKNHIFKYECIHSTGATGIKYLYSNINNGHFGIKKVIFGKASPENAIFDINGDYGVTNNCFAIPVISDEDGQQLMQFIQTELFNDIINSTKTAGFSTEYEIFTYFKKGFWKEFI